MGKYPSVSGRCTDVYFPDVEYSHPHEEGPLPPVGGVFITLVATESMTITKTRVDSNQTITTH